MIGARLAIGVGLRTGVAAEAVVAAVREALSGLDTQPAGLFTLDRRAGEPGLRAAAHALGLALEGLHPAALQARSAEAVTRSRRSEAATGVPSVAETAALAGAGPGSRLVMPRRVVAGVTVAVATAEIRA
jgi:cobalt-precorrin 5A hydrolase